MQIAMWVFLSDSPLEAISRYANRSASTRLGLDVTLWLIALVILFVWGMLTLWEYTRQERAPATVFQETLIERLAKLHGLAAPQLVLMDAIAGHFPQALPAALFIEPDYFVRFATERPDLESATSKLAVQLFGEVWRSAA